MTSPKLRDQDVAIEAMLETVPQSDSEARGNLQRLERRRGREAFRVAQRLRGSRVRGIHRALRRFDRSPRFTVDEDAPPSVVLPALRSRVAAIDLHPAWSLSLVADSAGNLRASDPAYDDQTTSDLLHQLRRRLKQVRYQLDVASRLMESDWMPALERLRMMQEALGVLQDVRMLDRTATLPPARVMAAAAAWDELRGERLAGVRRLLDGASSA